MRKNIFNLLAVAFLGSAFVFTACEGDPELDPLQFQNVKKGTMLAMRTTSYANRNNKAFVGGVDTFNVLTAVNANPNFTLVADLVTENFADFQSVDIFTVNKGVRTKVTNILPAAFAEIANNPYRRATITIPFKTLLGSRAICEFTPSDPASGANSGIDIEADINMNDGTIIPASSVVNSGLFNAAAFYPAHSVKYVAVGPVVAPQKLFLASGDSAKVDLLSYLPAAQRSSVTGFKWRSEDNPAVNGEVASGTGRNFNGGKLVNTTTRKQSVVYTVTPVLSNGCDGRAFTITTAFCDGSDLAGTFDGETTAFGGWEGGKTQCTATWKGKVIWEEGLEGIYDVKTVFNATNTFLDFSHGGYYVCYSTNAQANLPVGGPGKGDLKLNHSCDILSASGKSQWGEIYTIKDVKFAAATPRLLTFTWTNDYGEGATVKLTRSDKDWPATIK
jgi:hypothetical protein